jgi:hypothetical protein
VKCDMIDAIWGCETSVLSEIRRVLESGLRKIKHGSAVVGRIPQYKNG